MHMRFSLRARACALVQREPACKSDLHDQWAQASRLRLKFVFARSLSVYVYASSAFAGCADPDKQLQFTHGLSACTESPE
jgi:hypothetical protein